VLVVIDPGGQAHLLEVGAGPPVVLLHGTGNSAGFFLPLLNELKGVRAMAPDLPGVGLSDPIDLPRNRYRETAVAWLDRLLDALELDTAALLGHSGGAVWALWYALLVAVGRDPIADRVAKAEFRVLVSPFALLSPSGFRRRSRVRPDELRQVAMPTLVVWGEQEPLGSVSVAQAVTELIPHARLVVLPTGHGPWLGQPAQTAATVVDFVR
jgi:pimeloyl-ACP methyl ester carboxylesterase